MSHKMMGCGTSSSNSATTPINPHQHQSQLKADDHLMMADTTQNIGNFLDGDLDDNVFVGLKIKETIYDAYHRLDGSICEMEKSCPGPRLATVEAWGNHLVRIAPPAGLPTGIAIPIDDASSIDANSLLNTPPATPNPDAGADGGVGIADGDRVSLEAERSATVRMAVQLGVAFDVQRARQNETHLAEVSIARLEHIGRELHADIVGHTRQRADHLLDSYAKLRALYDEQDGLLASVTSGSYSSPDEELFDRRLDAARQSRDKLGAVAEQWRIAGNLLRTGAKEATHASELWSLVAFSKDATERIQLTLDAQAACQSALVAIDYAHKALPHVDYPHLTRRRLVATRHACEYLLTDMADKARLSHTTAVLDAFRLSVDQTHQWLHETFRKTLHTNLADAEVVVGQAAQLLRKERARYMLATKQAKRLYVGPQQMDIASLETTNGNPRPVK